MTTTIKYGSIQLEKYNQSELVPDHADKISLKTSDKKALALAIKHDIPALLIGETGTGKTSVIRELAYKLKANYTRINLSGYTSPDDLIGSKSVKNGSTYYENGVLTNAMLRGDICVLDELNTATPDLTPILHGLLDEDKRITLPNGDIITPAKSFRIFSTINPDYEGTKSLNRALLNRFGISLYIDILTPAKESKLLIDRTGLDPELVRQFVALAWLNRKAYLEKKLLTLISTRSLLQLADLIKHGINPKQAYLSTVVNKARDEEKKAFLDYYNIIFKTNDPDLMDYLPEVLTPEEVKNNEENILRYKEAIENYRDERAKNNEAILELNSKVEDLKYLNKLLKEKVKTSKK